jgi:hypothetical protein
MSESGKPVNPDGTINLDRLDPGELSVDVGADVAARNVGRHTPPPLPPSSAQPPLTAQPSVRPGRAAASLPPPRTTAKTIGYVVMFVALIALAIIAGRSVGNRAQGARAIGPGSPSASATAGAPRPSAPADSVLVLPTIEMK